MNGKGSVKRPCLISREEEELRWKYAKGLYSGSLEDFKIKINDIRERTGLPKGIVHGKYDSIRNRKTLG